ncbi:MFS transporter [Lysinibacillus sp. UGB7]|uniref:MFS transporter n=1 Tax=Lysinibacillus sp. UGB7 TaxID=3411039 RepID=UPI003B7F186F
MPNQTEPKYGGMKQVLAVSLGLFLVFLDSTVVNISLPNIMNDYHINLNLASWIINSFVLTLAILLITLGKIADFFGRIRIFLVGVIVFAISSLLCGMAPTVEVLIAARVLQGIGGAMIIPTSMMLVRTAVPPEKLGLAMGIWGAVGALAVAIGPSLGGVVTEFINWRWIFYINVPVIMIAFPFILVAFKGSRDVKSPFKLDVLGVIVVSIALYFLTFAILQGEKLGWTSTTIYIYFTISLIATLLFIFIEKRTNLPLVDFTIFKNEHYLGGILSNFLGGILLMGTLILLPIYLTQVKEFTTLHASFLITPLSAVMLVVAPIVGRLIDKIGYQIPMLFGYVFTVIGFVFLLKLTPDTEFSMLITMMSLLGTGLGIIMVTSVTVCTVSVSEKHVSLGSGIFATARNLGGALGVSLFVSITLSFLNQYANDVVADGVARFENSNMPDAVKTIAIENLQGKKDTLFEGERKVENFVIPQEMQNQFVAKKLEETLKQMPQAVEVNATPDIEKKVTATVNVEIANIEKEVNHIQNTIQSDAQGYIAEAMTKAFWCGLLLTCIFSLSLIFLRKKQVEEIL